MKLLFRATAVLTLIAAGSMLAGPVSATEPVVKSDVESDRSNLCFGGLEDGKIIVTEEFLSNPHRQTTRLGCEVDGGDPVRMPDLPHPDAARIRLA